MALEITTRRDLPFGVELPCLGEVAMGPVSLVEVTQLQRQAIRMGHEQVQFGDCFSCRVVGEQPGLIWSGDTGRLHYLGQGLRGGYVRVEGNAGDHAGSNMRGGRLEIAGNAGHWLASDLRGGAIVVDGNCGPFAAASLPAQRRGMKGGIVMIRGSADPGLGRRMRRGILAVEGNVRDPGTEMLAGTLVLGGHVTGGIGTLMKRGTIVCLQRLEQEQSLNLRRGIVFEPLVWRLIKQHLREQQVALRHPGSGKFQLWHDGPHSESRGEVWAAC
jgi:formylmethanofuran dehydrogenase subunit C